MSSHLGPFPYIPTLPIYLFIFPNHSETSHRTAEVDQTEIPALTLAA